MRKKLKRFADNKDNKFVFEPEKPGYEEIKGNWNKEYFQNEFPITLELACGKGEYTTGLAKHYPERNFIGVDIKGDRIWYGSQEAEEEGLNNVGFLRTQIQLLEKFFVENEVRDIWITFPDPRPKKRDIKRRLTSPRFLDMYKKVMSKDGWVYFKTDNPGLFDYTLEVLEERKDIKNLSFTRDLYHSEFMDEHHGIKTRFEKMFFDKGFTIKYLKFQWA
ncbi:tRNA (guanosine(46)-N7)-methyltransferase TrmB [Marinigracilibium pacificum]|uniref:tRNA (guanine-N(7)-)-methyltransferase n=1 Tax=Marinigracilibium pacificum TaxID=2729599 RepID=A0A848J5I5_9BACT|nr:tRNA (guanosine(46)-N7)-methyltransferase TrmB [Marinigracilibium pacificum]NMM48402.1 tRNA (guanosine(46)-N7)-methyltransferase TrmB [Marinigracilibium pacificum]